MRKIASALALLAAIAGPAGAFSPHQVFMMLAAYDAWQSECAAAGDAFDPWTASALRQAAARYGVDARDEASAKRIALYAKRIREGIEPDGKAQWCATVRKELETILRAIGNT